MKFIIILLSLFIIPVLLNSEPIYIQVTKLNNKNSLKVVKHRLDKFGLNMLYKRKDKKFIVFSGPYKTIKTASNIKYKLKKYFPKIRILYNKKNTSTKVIKSVENKEFNDKYFFINLSTGYASAPSSHIIKEGSITITEPNDKGLVYNLGVGYEFKNRFLLGFNYMNLNLKDLVFSNIYGDIKYKFKSYKKYTPYFGLLIGFSDLKWKVDPIKAKQENLNNKSESIFWGSSAGIFYDGFSNLSIYSGYQCIFMNHSTNITNKTTTATNFSVLQHSSIHLLKIGFLYRF